MGSGKHGFGHGSSCCLWKHFGAKEVLQDCFGSFEGSGLQLGFGQEVDRGTSSCTSVWAGGPVGFGQQGTPSFGRISVR